MLYKISTASMSYSDDKPSDEAFLKKVPNWHERTCKSFEEFDKRFGAREGSWLSKGTNHAVTKDGIIRQEGVKDAWVVRISNLKQLQNFITKYGRCVIDGDSILIYDDYIE
jgi:hypothetical protein